MKLAFVVPALRKLGPVIVAKDIIKSIAGKVEGIDVLYFDNRRPEIKIVAKFKAVVGRKYSVENMANAYYNLYKTLCP